MKQSITLIALLLSVVLMAMPAFAAVSATEPTTEAATEAETEAATEAETEAESEAATEAESEAESEAAIEAAAEAATEAATEAPTEAPTLPPVNEEARKLYTSAMDKLGKVSSIEMKGSMKMSITDGDDSIDMLLGLTTREKITGDKVEMEVVVHDSELGKFTEAYYKDGYYYQKIGDLKVKTKMSFDDASTMGYEVDKNLTEDMFRGATIEKLDNGNTRINCVISADLINEAVTDSVNGMLDSIADGSSAKYGNINYGMEFDEMGNFVSYRMGFKAAITIEGETVTATYTTIMNVKSVNQIVAIAYPNLSSYIAA